jgi:hypothetical protein
MRRSLRTSIVGGLLVAALLLGVGTARAGSGYDDPDYARYDLDNMARSLTGRSAHELLDLDYGYALLKTAGPVQAAFLARQLQDLGRGRIYGTIAQIPGAAVGDPVHHDDQVPVEVAYTARTGAKVVAHLFSDGRPGPHPGIVITPGSLQGMQQWYWWAARSLSDAGYQVLTFDAQGQGFAETFGHAPGDLAPTGAGFPFQQEGNFVDGTVDALRFLLSTPAHPYVPAGWSAADVAKAKAAGDASIAWANPLASRLDPNRLGLAGHSLGARAVSVVQQCSDLGTVWKRLPLCTGRSFPIKVVVAWDRLSADGVVPVVPAMDQQADGYFLNPQPAFTAPEPRDHLGGLDAWTRAGLDAYALTIRGGTHIEWTDIPYVLPATSYGHLAVEHYTRAWIDRYLSPSQSVREQASATLADAPKVDDRDRGRDQLPWTASFLSARYLGGFRFHDARGGVRVAHDLRAYGGVSKVGDWRGANADHPAVRQP